MSITNYFKSAKKTVSNIPIEDTNTICQKFYDECLNEKMSECKNSSCADEKRRLQSYLGECKATLKQVNWNVERIIKTIARKEATLAKLEMEKQKHQPTVTAATISKSMATTGTTVLGAITNGKSTPGVITPDNLLFSKFSDLFSTIELAELRSNGNSKSSDSTFVLKIIRMLYKNDLDKVVSLSVTGNSRKGEKKEKMAQQHIDVVEGMLAERLSSLKLNSTEYALRLKMGTTHMKNALANIIKTKKKVDDAETLEKINSRFNSEE